MVWLEIKSFLKTFLEGFFFKKKFLEFSSIKDLGKFDIPFCLNWKLAYQLKNGFQHHMEESLNETCKISDICFL